MFVQAVTLVHVGQRKAQQESQAFTTEQRGAEAVGRRIGRFVAQKLGAVLDNVEVVVAQHIVFEGVIFICQKLGEVQRFLFAEIVENGGVIGGAGIERTLNRLRRAILILHVVGEHHQLRDVDEAPKARVAAARDDAVALGQHAFPVVGFLDLDKRQRHAVDEQDDVGPELIVTVLAGQLCDDMETVVVEVLEIDQPSA